MAAKADSKPEVPSKKASSMDDLKALQDHLPEDAKKKLDEIKTKLESFKEKALKKFDEYVMGMSLLPPSKEEKLKDKINVLVLVDDSDSQKMSKLELRDKLSSIMQSMADEIDKSLFIEVLLLSELWQSCYDAKYDWLQMVALSAPVYDKGMMAAIKISEIHKNMVLKKFEKYIVSYVLAGSLVQGRATKQSDIDVFIVIDDTDVKKMTRAELKDKLRAIIIGMGYDAGKMTGIENKLNIQVYILTDFWEYIKEANPIIFTFLRDGIPLYDRGIFMPWKQLLRMGRIKPSPESIDLFMQSGDQTLQRIKYKIKEMGLEDTFWAIITPSQAALMLYGIPPPTPKETPEIMREVFVKKTKLLEDKYIKILERNIQVRKDLEHGTKKELSATELETLINDADDYLKRLKKLFSQIEGLKEEESVLHTYESIVTLIRDIMRLEGVEKVSESDLVKIFEEGAVSKGLIPEKFLRILKDIVKAKKDYDEKKLSKTDLSIVQKKSAELIRFLIEYIQRKRGRELERAKIRVKHGNKYGEILLLDKSAYIIHDVDNEQKEISLADITPDGSLANIRASNLEAMEKDLAKVEIPPKAFIKERLFEKLKDIFGRDVEVLINY